MTLQERMRELRKERKETQRQVADAIGVTDRQYQRFETGSICLDLKISWALRTTSAYRWIIWPPVGPEGNVEAGFPPFRGTCSCRGVQPFYKAGHCECSFLQTTFKLFAERIYHDF